MKDEYSTSIIQTTNVNIKPENLKGDFNKLILDSIKRKYEGVCNNNGYILKNSIELIERSMGQIKTINSESIINYNITYKADIISPSVGDIYECYVETKNKLGIIAYLKINESSTFEETPFIIIIPKEYMNDEGYTEIKCNDKLNITIESFRIKYMSNHIQIVATLV